MANEAKASVLEDLLRWAAGPDRMVWCGDTDSWYANDGELFLSGETPEELAGLLGIPDRPTKPEVVDGEVTERAEADEIEHEGRIAMRWSEIIASGQEPRPFRAFRAGYHVARVALGSTAESRGFAAGRASVTAKAEGWVAEYANQLAGLLKLAEADKSKSAANEAYLSANYHAGTVGAYYAALALLNKLAPAPAPADTELKGET